MINIQQLSLEVNIGVDTLRIWERRYGFPNPERDKRGYRCYPEAQVEELRIVRKLQILGHKPNKIFALSADQRRQLILQETQNKESDHAAILPLITELTPLEIEHELNLLWQQYGPTDFILQFAKPLIRALGNAWTAGRISIAREHLVSDQLEILLKNQLKHGQPEKPRAKLLFLTLSGERHKLGLLLSALLFQQHDLDCIFINEEIPLTEVPKLAEDLGVAAVATSFSAHYPSRQARQDLASLRNMLAAHIKLVAGGHAVRKKFIMKNLYICPELEKIPALSKKIFTAH